MLKLCGFSVSNYYNKVKLQLLEKGVPFEEELVWPSRDESYIARTPMERFRSSRSTAARSSSRR